ncbi:MAG: DUF4595 domain-containing protein [Prevotella sp.]|nr:DUF4595 domain-containing protein [Prevotella sp.]
MKKNYLFYFTMLLALMMSMTFVACSDDDDDDNGGSGTPSTDNAVIITDDGEKLMVQSVLDKWGNGVTYTYNDQWLPTSVSCWGNYTYNFTYESSKALCTVVHNDLGEGEFDDEELTFSFNSAGYVSKMEVKETYEDKYESGSGSGTFTYSYDNDGHLTGASGTLNGNYTEDGDTYSYTDKVSATLTWTNGNFTKYSKTLEENESGYSYKETETGNFEYGSEENVYKQPTMAYGFSIYDILWGTECELMFTGIFGKGTAMLPTSYTCTSTYSDEDWSDTGTDEFSYTKNDDNTIHTEVADGGTLYTYTYATVGTRSIMPEWTRSTSGTTGNGHKSLLKRLRARHHAEVTME